MKIWYVNIENENQTPHSFMKKHSCDYYSINDCPWNENFEIITELTFVGLQLYREGKKNHIMS